MSLIEPLYDILEREERFKFKIVGAFAQDPKVRGRIGIVLATLRKQKTKTKIKKTSRRKNPGQTQSISSYLNSEVRSIRTPSTIELKILFMT